MKRSLIPAKTVRIVFVSDFELTHLTSMSSTRSDVSDRKEILYSDLKERIN